MIKYVKKKYIVAAFISVATLSICISAFAESYTTVSANRKRVDISLSSDYGKTQYMVYLLKPGESMPSYESGVSTAFDKIDGIDAGNDVKGTFTCHNISLEFTDGAPYGVYKAVVGGGEFNGKIMDVTYATPDDEMAALSEIKGTTASTIGSVLNKYQGIAWSLDFTKTIYQKHKNEVETSITAILDGNVTNAQEVVSAFEKACMLTEIKYCDKTEIYNKLFLYENYLGIEYPSEICNKNTETVEIFSGLRKSEDITTPLELKNTLRASEAVAKVNSVDRDVVMGVIKEYNDMFNANFEGNYKNVDSYQVAKEIISGRKYNTPKDILIKFNEIINKLSKPKQESVVGGSGGGKGGSSPSEGNKYYPSLGVVNSELVSSLDINGIFTDLENAMWAISYINYMAENNIMNGDGDGRFRPNDTITRAEFIKVLISALKLENAEIANPIDFIDVPSESWYASYVRIGSGLGITNGTSSTTFAPNELVSRQDAAVMIINAIKAKELNLYADEEKIEFSDVENISDYAVEAVSQLVNSGVISGYEDGTFRPKNSLLRAETAKLIYSIISGLKE